MTESFVKTFEYDNGEIQRVQVVTSDSFDDLRFIFPEHSPITFGKITNLYRNFIVPKCPWIFGQMVLYYIPKEMEKEVGDEAELCDWLGKNAKIKGGRFVYKNQRAKEICERLTELGYLEIVSGKLPHTKFLPVGRSLGFLSESNMDAEVKVNSHFFIMDCFDLASPYDRIGTPIGLMVKNGEVINPPMYEREAFLVTDDGKVSIRKMGVTELELEISSVSENHEIPNCSGEPKVVLKHGENATVFERPATCRISRIMKGRFIVVVGCKVVGVYKNGGMKVPSSGFVIKVADDCPVNVGDTVTYKGLENIRFGVQVGNSIIVNGVKTSEFISKFYNIYRQFGAKAYPPSLYPLDYENARAARIALGAMKDARVCIFWAEGAKKTGYVAGEQSRGASLTDMANIAESLGLYNAVNLDGGGSAQMLVNNKRELNISDRNVEDDTDMERGVPVGIAL